MSVDAPPRLDKTLVRRHFDLAADRYDQHAVLQQQVAERMIERLQWVRLAPQRILDVGSGTGQCGRLLAKQYRRVPLVSLDLAPSMLRHARQQCSRLARWRRPESWVCGDVEALPLADDSVDLVVSSLALQWLDQPDQALAECWRVLRPGGLLMFTSFGPDTLYELRQAWGRVDAWPHVNHFLDMHDLGDALMRSRFADPVMDAETFTLTYETLPDLMRDLKAIGAQSAFRQRPSGLVGRRRFQQVIDAYEGFRQQGRLPASYEVVYGHAWMPPDKAPQRGGPSEVSVPLSRLRRSGQ